MTLAAKRLQAKSANVAEIVNTLPAAHKQELQVRVQNALAAGESSDVANAKSRVRVVTARVMGEMATAVHAQVHAQAAAAVGRELSPAEQKVVSTLSRLNPRDKNIVLDALGWDSDHHQVNEPLSYEAIGEKYKTRSTGAPMNRASVQAVLAKVGINEAVLDTMRAHAMPEASVEELGISGDAGDGTGYRVTTKKAAGADDFVVNERTAREQKETDAVLAAATPEAKKAAEAEIAARKSFTDTEFEEKRKATAAQGQAKVDAEMRTAGPKTVREALARDLARNSISEVNIEDATEHWDNETDTSKGEHLFADLHVLVQAAIVRAYRNNKLTAQRQGELIDENAYLTRQTRAEHAGANPEGAGRVGIERPADEGAAPRLLAPGRQVESAQRSAPTEQVGLDHRTGVNVTTQRERNLRAKAHDAEHLGDIKLGNGQFVSFDDATEAARSAIESGVLKNMPFQYNNVLDIAPRDWLRMVDAMNDDGAGWAASAIEGASAGKRSDAPAPQGGTIAGISAALAKLMPVNAERVKVVQSLADIPANVRRSVGVTENTQAFVIDGKAYLIADQIAPGTERAVFLHEVGAHLGMENLLDEDHYDVLVDKILEWAGRTDGSLEQRLAVKAMERVHSAGTEDHQLNSEMVAYFIEEAVNAGVDPTAMKHSTELGRWLAELMQAFKKALAKLGLVDGRGLTAQDLVDLAYGAAKIEMDGGVGSLAQAQSPAPVKAAPATVAAKAPAASTAPPVKSPVRDEPLIEMRKRRSVLQALRTCLG